MSDQDSQHPDPYGIVRELAGVLARVAVLERQFSELRTELRGTVADLRTELSTRMHEVQQHLTQQDAFSRELRHEHQQLRSQVATGQQETITRLEAIGKQVVAETRDELSAKYTDEFRLLGELLVRAQAARLRQEQFVRLSQLFFASLTPVGVFLVAQDVTSKRPGWFLVLSGIVWAAMSLLAAYVARHSGRVHAEAPEAPEGERHGHAEH